MNAIEPLNLNINRKETSPRIHKKVRICIYTLQNHINKSKCIWKYLRTVLLYYISNLFDLILLNYLISTYYCVGIAEILQMT